MVLISAEPGEAIGKRHDARRHCTFGDQPIEPFRQIFAEVLPIGMRRSARREAYEIDEQRQAPSRCARRHIDIDQPLGRIAEQIAL